jgi:hypothetical protein
MKKILLLIAFCSVNFIQAQNVDYTLEWNSSLSRYEFFVTRDIDAAVPFTNQSITRVTIGFPTDPTVTFTHTNENMGSFAAPTRFTNPGSYGDDYMAFTNSTGGSMVGVLYAGVKTLWISFTTNVGCIDGMRLYVNGVDPDSSEPDLVGADITQGFNTATIAGAVDEYRTNTGGNPSCAPLSIGDEAIIAYSMYPNPVKNELTITFAEQQETANVKVYSVTGQLVYDNSPVVVDNKVTVSLKALSVGVYITKVTTDLGSNTKRLIIE